MKKRSLIVGLILVLFLISFIYFFFLDNSFNILGRVAGYGENLQPNPRIHVNQTPVIYTQPNLTDQMSLKKINSFSFVNISATGIINETSKEIFVRVPAGTNLTGLIPTIVTERPVLVDFNEINFNNSVMDIDYGMARLGRWSLRVDRAKALAFKRNGLLIVQIGNSATCDYCQKLAKTVFNKPEWKEYAAQKGLPLMYLDTAYPECTAPAGQVQRYWYRGGYPFFVVLRVLENFTDNYRLEPYYIELWNNNTNKHGFVFRPGLRVNGVNVSDGFNIPLKPTPADFIEALEIFTGPLPDLNITLVPDSGVAMDFTNPVKYTIYALDGSSINYTVKVQVYSDSCSSGTFCSASSVLNATNQNTACAGGSCYRCDNGFFYDSGLGKCITGICNTNPGCLNENFVENSTINSDYCSIGKCFSCNNGTSYNSELKKCITGICNSNPGCLNETAIGNATSSNDYCSNGMCFQCAEGMSYDASLKVCKSPIVPSNFTEIVLASSDLNSGKDNFYDLGTIINVSSNNSFGRIYILDLSSDNSNLGLKVNNFSRFTTSIGNEIALDLNDDSNIDVSLLFSGISEGKPKVSIKKFSFYENNFEENNVNENNFEENNSVSENSNVEEENLDSLKITFYVLVGLIILIIISLIIFYLVWFFRFRKKEEKENLPVNQNISPVAYQGRFARR